MTTLLRCTLTVLFSSLLMSLFSCKKEEPESIPNFISRELEVISATDVLFRANIQYISGSSEIAECGFVWSESPAPTAESSAKVSSDKPNQYGNFEKQVEGLNAGTTYYMRPYIVDKNGLSYGDEKSFITPVPTVTEWRVDDYAANRGSKVTIFGNHFSPKPTNNIIKFGEVEAVVSSSNKTYIILNIPSEVVGATKVSLTVGNKTVSVADSFYVFIGKWIKKNDMPETLTQGVSFSINDKVYVLAGAESSYTYNSPPSFKFWEYNPVSDVWQRKADFPGIPRRHAVAFSLYNKGYVGTGLSNGDTLLNDFWQYNPSTDKWTQLSNFPGTARRSAISFAIGDKGYIGGGYDGTFRNDFWEFDPITNQWYVKSDIPNRNMDGASGFGGINSDKAYVLSGNATDNEGTITTSYRDFWEYSQSSNQWSQKEDFPGSPRKSLLAFSINNKGYIGGGYNIDKDSDVNKVRDYWEYSEEKGWTGVSKIPTARYSSAVSVLSGKVYIMGGHSIWWGQKEVFEFDPNF
jgi:N-acetylneuraminic acid mutarotase